MRKIFECVSLAAVAYFGCMCFFFLHFAWCLYPQSQYSNTHTHTHTHTYICEIFYTWKLEKCSCMTILESLNVFLLPWHLYDSSDKTLSSAVGKSRSQWQRSEVSSCSRPLICFRHKRVLFVLPATSFTWCGQTSRHLSTMFMSTLLLVAHYIEYRKQPLEGTTGLFIHTAAGLLRFWFEEVLMWGQGGLKVCSYTSAVIFTSC